MAVNVQEFGQVKGRGRPGQGGPRKGSRRWVRLSDGSVVKWWRNEWRFTATRWDTKVATSLQHRAMSKADDNGTERVVEERYGDQGADYDRFAKRMISIMGAYDFLRMVQWIKG